MQIISKTGPLEKNVNRITFLKTIIVNKLQFIQNCAAIDLHAVLLTTF